MIEFNGQINLPNPNFGTTERTITANEVVRTCDTKALAKEVVHEVNGVVNAGVAELIINSFCRAMVSKMTEGFAIQMTNDGDVMMRIFPDLHLATPTGNVNLTIARRVLGEPTLTEEQMVERAGEIIDRVGVKVSVRAVAQQKFTELLKKEGYSVRRLGIVTATAAHQAEQQAEDNGETTGGQSQQGGSTNPPSGGENEDGE